MDGMPPLDPELPGSWLPLCGIPPPPDDPEDGNGEPLLPEEPLLPDEPDCGDGRELPEDPEPPMELELHPARASISISTGIKTGLNNESIPVRQALNYKGGSASVSFGTLGGRRVH